MEIADKTMPMIFVVLRNLCHGVICRHAMRWAPFLFFASLLCRGGHRFEKHAPLKFISKHDGNLSCNPPWWSSVDNDRQKPITTDKIVGNEPRPSLVLKLLTLGEPLQNFLPSVLSYTIFLNAQSYLFSFDIIGCTHKPLLWKTMRAWIDFFTKEVTAWWRNPRKNTNKMIFHKNKINVTCKWLFPSQLYLPRVCRFNVLSMLTFTTLKMQCEPLL